MDLIDPADLTGPVRDTPPIQLQAVPGLPEGKIFVVSGVDPEEVLPGETRAEAYARLGRAVVIDLGEGDVAAPN